MHLALGSSLQRDKRLAPGISAATLIRLFLSLSLGNLIGRFVLAANKPRNDAAETNAITGLNARGAGLSTGGGTRHRSRPHTPTTCSLCRRHQVPRTLALPNKEYTMALWDVWTQLLANVWLMVLLPTLMAILAVAYLPSAIGLYWAASNAMGIAQSLFLRWLLRSSAATGSLGP